MSAQSRVSGAVASGGLGLLSTASAYSRLIGRVLSCDRAIASRQSASPPQRILRLSAMPSLPLGIVASFREAVYDVLHHHVPDASHGGRSHRPRLHPANR